MGITFAQISCFMLKKPLFLLFLFGLSIIGCQEGRKELPTADVVIVQVNDIYEIDGVNQGKEGNLARVQGLVDSLKKLYPQVLLVHAGDFLNPSLIGNLREASGEKVKGRHMVEVMNAMSFDAVAFGNHELDLKQTVLQKRLDEMNFDMLVANLFEIRDNKLNPFTQNGSPIQGLKQFEVQTKSGKRRLSLLSVLLPYNHKDYVRYTAVDSTVAAVLNSIDEEKGGLFLLSHLSRKMDNAIGEKFDRINLIMGGHDHYHFCDTVGSQRYVTKADANARTAWVHFVNWNDDTKEFLTESKLIKVDDSIQKNSTVQKVIDQWNQFASQKTEAQGYRMDRVLAELDYPLDAREEVIRSEATDFGQLVCEAMASVFDTADVMLLNSGSVRYDDLIISPMTEGDVLKALPFGGGIKGAYVSGAELAQIYAASDKNTGTGGYLQSVQFPAEIAEYGMYYVITTDYMSAGKEKNFEFLKEKQWSSPSNLTEAENDIRKVLIRYLSEKEEAIISHQK